MLATDMNQQIQDELVNQISNGKLEVVDCASRIVPAWFATRPPALMQAAIQHGQFSIVAYLLQQGFQIPTESMVALADKLAHVSLLKYLLISPYIQENHDLILEIARRAVTAGNHSVLIDIVRNTAPDSRLHRQVVWIIAPGLKCDMAQCMMRDVITEDDTCYIINKAIRLNQVDIISIMSRFTDLTRMLDARLTLAIRLDRCAIVEIMISSFAVDRLDVQYLNMAISMSNAEMVRILASKTRISEYLDLAPAVKYCALNVLQALIAAKVDIVPYVEKLDIAQLAFPNPNAAKIIALIQQLKHQRQLRDAMQQLRAAMETLDQLVMNPDA